MIKHIVMWKVKENVEGISREQNIRRMQALLETLPGLIPEIQLFEVGQALETKNASFDLVLYSSFASPKDLKHYLDHPEHQKVAEFVRAVTAERAAMDYEI